jgi:UTP:GlnB (protein PII) uridylyltransferase
MKVSGHEELLNCSPENEESSAHMGRAPSDTAHPAAGGFAGAGCSATIRHAAHAIASEGRPEEAVARLTLLRPLVAQAHSGLRERFEAGGAAEEYLNGRTRLADSAVAGLLHIASISSRIRDRSMVPPLAAVAVGGFGRRELAPGSDVDLLFLLPERCRSQAGDVAPATRACISAVVAGLWDLGFAVDHSARSVQECLELAQEDATVFAGLLDRRFVWGSLGLFYSLNNAFTARFSRPDADHRRVHDSPLRNVHACTARTR